LPSVRPEPFGLALLDAMAHGIACIATDAGGPRDIIRDGETGLLVQPGNAMALADAIEQLHADNELRAQLGRAAASHVRERFSIDATARRIGEVYEELLSPS
jgi:mannosyltransferase